MISNQEDKWEKREDRFGRNLQPGLYRGAHGVMILYDITDQGSYSHVKQWIQEVDRYARPGVLKMVVATKNDLVTKRVIDTQEAQV